MPPALRDAVFFTRNDLLVMQAAKGAVRVPDAFVPTGLRQVLELDSTLSAPLTGDALSGRIFFTGRHDWSSDDLALAGIAARLFSAQLDQFAVQEQMRRTAVGEERIRVARDLHDGLLQSLTGVALQIQTLLQATNDDSLRERLSAVQEIIAMDQRELRSFVSQLRPQSAGVIEPPLSARLRSLAERMSKQWSVDIEVSVDPPTPALPSFVASEVYSLVNESLANAAKHAAAAHIRAAVTVDGREVRIVVEDDGDGFPFEGTYDLARLDAEHRGPVTLKERIASLGGDLLLRTTPEGSRIEMRVRA
jgi:signal transduction histidine kinase